MYAKISEKYLKQKQMLLILILKTFNKRRGIIWNYNNFFKYIHFLLKFKIMQYPPAFALIKIRCQTFGPNKQLTQRIRPISQQIFKQKNHPFQSLKYLLIRSKLTLFKLFKFNNYLLANQMIEDFASLAVSTPFVYPTQAANDAIPEDFKYLSQIKSLDSIVVNNFKSFKGEHYIGPFLKFTSIIGQNGSGKSNVLDAILFALSGDKLKGMYFEPKEYIHRGENETYYNIRQDNRECWVSLKFQLKGGSKPIHLKRTVDTNNDSTFYINFQEVNKASYVAFLRSKNLIANEVCNFAIWQGATQTLLNKDPTKLRNELQILSGSIFIKEQFDRLNREHTQIDKKIKFKADRKERVRADKKSAKALKSANDQYKKAQQKYKDLRQKLVISKMLQKQIQVRNLQDQIYKTEGIEAGLIEDYNKKKAQAQQEFKQTIQLKKQINQINLEITQLNFQVKELGSRNIIVKEQTVKDLQDELKKDTQILETFQYKKQQIQKRIPSVQSSNVISEYLDMYSVWQKQNTILKATFQKKQQVLADLDRLIDSKYTLVESLKQKNKKFQIGKQQQAKKLKISESQLSQIQDTIGKCKQDLNNFLKKYTQSQKILKAHYDNLGEQNKYIEEMQFRLTAGIQDVKEREITRRLANINGYLGVLGDKVKANRSQYAMCVGIMLSSLQRHILVQNQQAAVEIAISLREMGRSRNLIILSNTKDTNIIFEELRNQLGDKAIPAIDVISYDRDIDKLGQFLNNHLKNKVICKNIDDAFEVRNRKVRGIKQIYTTQGDVIYMNGLISSNGNKGNVKKYQKFDASIQKSIQAEIRNSKQKIQQINTKIKNIKAQFKENEVLRKEEQIKSMQKKRDQIKAEVEKWKSYKPNNKKLEEVVVFQKQLAQLRQRRDKLNLSITSTERQIEMSPAFKQFMQKHGIQSIECFRNSHNLEQLQRSFKLKNQLTREIVQIQSQMEKIASKNTNGKLNDARIQLNKSLNHKYKKELQKGIKEKQDQIQSIKNKLAKIKISQIQPFHSEIPQLKQKMSQIINSLNGLLQSLNLEHQTQIVDIDYEPVFQDIKSSMEYVTISRIQEYQEKLLKNKIQIQQTLQRLISFSLLNSQANPQDNIIVYDNQMEQLQNELEQLQTIKQRLKTQLDRQDDIRKNIFNRFLNDLRSLISRIYSYLTMTAGQQREQRHGTADIYLQDESNPFVGGVYFVPTPPSKRFVYDVQQLSGGQKSMAYLAFMYAVGLASKAPFIVFDEVDAFLDKNNLYRMKRLLDKARDEGHIQCLVISHKETIFENSESLVGISNHKIDLTSRAFSLKLQ